MVSKKKRLHSNPKKIMSTATLALLFRGCFFRLGAIVAMNVQRNADLILQHPTATLSYSSPSVCLNTPRPGLFPSHFPIPRRTLTYHRTSRELALGALVHECNSVFSSFGTCGAPRLGTSVILRSSAPQLQAGAARTAPRDAAP